MSTISCGSGGRCSRLRSSEILSASTCSPAADAANGGPRARSSRPYDQRVRRITLSQWLAIVAVLGGLVIEFFAVPAVVRDLQNDAAWAGVLLGVAFPVFGVAVSAFRDDPGDRDDDDDDFRPPPRLDRSGRVAEGALAVIAFTAAWAVTRLHHKPLDSALYSAVIASALPLASRALDRLARRRGEQADGADD